MDPAALLCIRIFEGSSSIGRRKPSTPDFAQQRKPGSPLGRAVEASNVDLTLGAFINSGQRIGETSSITLDPLASTDRPQRYQYVATTERSTMDLIPRPSDSAPIALQAPS